MSPKRKVLIIDDSAVARKVLSSICSQSAELEVVGTAPDAMVGLRKIESLQPDVITLDVEMPGMDGLTFLEKLMKSDPLPVVMVSAYTESGSSAALRALDLPNRAHTKIEMENDRSYRSTPALNMILRLHLVSRIYCLFFLFYFLFYQQKYSDILLLLLQ